MIQSESGGTIVVVVVVGIGFALLLYPVLRHRRRGKRLKPLFKEADIRMVGGPLDGAPLDYLDGGSRWPPKSEVILSQWVEEQNHYISHIYERTEEGEYHFLRTLPHVAVPPLLELLIGPAGAPIWKRILRVIGWVIVLIAVGWLASVTPYGSG